ncbi:HpcH/HpaI aldolase family protein [Microbacterium sp. RG1]|uniref:HpcH/HpaI aldolase family protein n=1 Tax=Microbacterium sp. RG1 TaxID=2489212 RepID=UPI0010CA2D9F|nr:aldolase/citrate lyase family protein [Microbacterium sp. RG1]QCQ17597.1 aldolase [Microbacterium sp. RG1]
MSADFAARMRAGGTAVGYWVVTDNPIATERVAMTGYDYIAVDMQHGLIGYQGMVHALLAISAANAPVGVVRVGENSVAAIGRALDSGASAVIVPLVNTAADAAAAVAATRYPPAGARSYGPMRSGLRIGPAPAEADASVLVLAMIETPQGLANLDEIAAVPGLDGLYVGPSDLTLALGGVTPTDPSVAMDFDAALRRVLAACRQHDLIPGIHSASGEIAQKRLADGFRFVSVASDLVHLEHAARHHLSIARSAS